jgi:DNA-binding beta-propeller fold protein YncE
MGKRRTAALAAGMLVCLLAGCASDGQGNDDTETSPPATPAAINGFIGGPSKVDTGGMFSEPSDVAVYAGQNAGTGDDKIFVTEADSGRSGRVQRLDGDGNFELAWGQDVVRAGAYGDTGTGPEICRRARSCKAAPPGSAAGAFRQPTGVAVDDRSGNVYVADTGNLRVQEFTVDGEFVRAWGWGVATGAAAFEVCAAKCRSGRHGKEEGNDNPGQFAPVVTGGIAVRPEQGDILVSDGGNDRVLQFAPGGRFVRTWELDVAPGGWPRQLAIDDEGIVYAADDRVNSRLVRFDIDEASDGENADRPQMRPLPSRDPNGDANNMGLDIDPTTGHLIAVWNPFGPMGLHVSSDPGADPVNWREQRSILDLGFVQSMYGITASPTTGVVYLTKSEQLNHRDAAGILDTCTGSGQTAKACHGLIVLGAAGAPRAVVERARRTSARTATLAGTVTAAGAATYSFQTSRKGEPWKDVDAARYVTATKARPVRATVRGLDAGARHRARISLGWFDVSEGETVRRASKAVPLEP